MKPERTGFAKKLCALVLAGSTAAAFSVPAAAAPLMIDTPLRASAASDGVQNVRWRGRHHRGWHGHRHHRHWDRHSGWGPALGGLAAGAIIGGAIANSRAQTAADDAYCSQRFRSYDPASGTYLGYDGLRHPCP
jgi:hypothetical protein